MNSNNLRNIAFEIQTITGVQTEVEPIPIDLKKSHIKLEYVGRFLDRDLQAIKINLILRGDGSNLGFVDEIMKADFALMDAIRDQYEFSDSEYNYIIESAQTKNEDFGLQFPEQATGIAEPDSNTADSSSRRIYTRLFQLQINYNER